MMTRNAFGKINNLTYHLNNHNLPYTRQGNKLYINTDWTTFVNTLTALFPSTGVFFKGGRGFSVISVKHQKFGLSTFGYFAESRGDDLLIITAA